MSWVYLYDRLSTFKLNQKLCYQKKYTLIAGKSILSFSISSHHQTIKLPSSYKPALISLTCAFVFTSLVRFKFTDQRQKTCTSHILLTLFITIQVIKFINLWGNWDQIFFLKCIFLYKQIKKVLFPVLLVLLFIQADY